MDEEVRTIKEANLLQLRLQAASYGPIAVPLELTNQIALLQAELDEPREHEPMTTTSTQLRGVSRDEFNNLSKRVDLLVVAVAFSSASAVLGLVALILSIIAVVQ